MKEKMKLIRRTLPSGTMQAEVYPWEGSNASVDVTKRQNEPAEINWFATTRKPGPEFDQFVEALQLAELAAKQMDAGIFNP